MKPLGLLPRLKLYALLIGVGVLALLRVRSNIAADAVAKMAKELEHADHNRAVVIRRAAASAGRVRRPDDARGYRD